MKRGLAWLLAALGLALASLLVALARPAAILALLQRSSLTGVAAAFLLAAVVLVLRGARLAVLVGSELPAPRAIGVMGVVSAAAAALPLRAGDLSLIPMLRVAGVRGAVRGLSFLLMLRILDVLALLGWVLVAAALLGRAYGWPALPLAAIPLATMAAVPLALRALKRLAPAWRRGGGARRRLLAQLLHVRRDLRHSLRSPARAAAALALSAGIWGGVWLLTLVLVRAMGLIWPAPAVLLGVLGATLGAAMPLNAVGNFGTLEAGWSAALASLGLPATEAVAAGFATHLWSLLFNALLGACCAVALALWRPGGAPSARRTRRNADRTPPGEP